MNHARTRRMAAGAVVVTLLAGLLTLLGWSPAEANHGSYKLEVSKEVTQVGKSTNVTLTARIVDENGAPPALGDGGDINVDFEVESGPGDDESGAVTRTSPDYTCTTSAQSLAGAARCQVTVKSNGPDGLGSATAGVSIIRAWIDHDGSNATTEADPNETRLSDPNTDCNTELPPLGATDGSDYDACTNTDDEGAESAGSAAERDTTDVVKIIFDNNAPIVVNCPELTKGPPESAIDVTCTVSDTDGLRRGGVVFDGEHQTGANDVNGDGPTDGDAADYQDFVSNNAGVVTITIDTAADPGFETGPATICVWYSDDNADDNDLGTGTPVDDPSYDSTGGAGDGGECDTEAAPPGDSTTTTTNSTERFQVEWEAAAPASLDVSPEVDPATTGQQKTLTATVLDQFGRQWTTGVTVNFELLAGSPGDQDAGSTLGSPDLSCSTSGTGANPGQCSRSYTSNAVGTDTICGWLPSKVTPSTSCNGETRDGNEGGAFIDVVQKTWSAPAASTTTTSTTPPAEDVSKTQGYTLVGADGGIFNYGTSEFHGSTGDMKLNQPVIGMANKKGGTGYWLVAKDGGIFTFGDAEFFGSTGDKKLNAPILGMEATPSGKGYYLFAADGGIFTFGDATFYGSTGDMKLNAPAVGMAVNQKGDGYWLVASDGGIFSFGNVPFYGSTGSMKLNQPVFDMASTAGDKGYWLLAKDGGLFSFGDANDKFAGSGVGSVSGSAIGMGTTPTTNGYWIADSRGAVFAFGDARFLGDRRGSSNNATTVGFATVPKK